MEVDPVVNIAGFFVLVALTRLGMKSTGREDQEIVGNDLFRADGHGARLWVNLGCRTA